MDLSLFLQVCSMIKECYSAHYEYLFSLQLLRNFYSEGLIDNRTFLAWLIQQLYVSNLAQLGFIARLLDEFVDGALATRALTRPLVEGCLTRISEVCHSFAHPHPSAYVDSLR